MDQKAVIKYCRELGCCDPCCVRYLGTRNPDAYSKIKEYLAKICDDAPAASGIPGKETEVSKNGSKPIENGVDTSATENGDDGPPSKRRKTDICVSCLGILQEDSYDANFQMVKEHLEKKSYDCNTFAVALSSPLTTLLREKAIILHLSKELPGYDTRTLTPLKEAWKWSFGLKLTHHIDKELYSGAVAPLLITLVLEYPDEMQELEILKGLTPSAFCNRNFRVGVTSGAEFSRNSVEQALVSVTLEKLSAVENWQRVPQVRSHVTCVSVMSQHVPVYLAGRYVKLSRELPQSPWFVNGERIMESSVQELIFAPLAKLFGMSQADAESRLKFMSAGREDVDVRCLGDGRPFAIEVADPRRKLRPEELQSACDEISTGDKVKVKQLVYITRDDLKILKAGEETKTKTYIALCIKLTHSKGEDLSSEVPPRVSDEDIANINAYRNTPKDSEIPIILQQKTPIRVLHRRPLLTRTKKILNMRAERVPDYPQHFLLHVETEAGTYVKEWVHGDVGRTQPSLRDALHAQCGIQALDVSAVHLSWPPNNS